MHEKVDESNLKPETKDLLKQLDCAVILKASLEGPSQIMKKNEVAPSDSSVKTEEINLGWKKTGPGFDEWKPDTVMKIKHSVSENFSTTLLGTDENFGDYTLAEKLTGKASRSSMLFPLDDSGIPVKDDDEAKALLADLKFEQGASFPVSYNTDFNMKSDDSFSRIFFYGMGCVLLTKQEEVSDSALGPFVVDMPYQDLKVRELYREYGARVHFSANQKVTGIYDYKNETLYKPGDAGWYDAKILAKVTAFLVMTVREHLTWTHLIVSNDATRESTLKLAPSHPIRRLLTVFTYGATEINLRAFDSLVPNSSLLHRSTGLDYSSAVAVFDMSFKCCDIYEPFSKRTYNPALQKLADQGKFPFITQGLEYYNIVEAFVRSWLEKAGEAANDKQAKAFYSAMKKSTKGQKYELPELSSKDAMLHLLASIIFTVTAYHELIGHVIDYVELPSRAGFRLTKANPSSIDLQSMLGAAMIGASTSSRMPQLMGKFSNFFGVGGAPAWEIDLWSKFQQDLVQQSKKVQKGDKKRTVEFKYFDPARFECSVSV